MCEQQFLKVSKIMMNKYIFSFLFILAIILASCKTAEISIEEKRECFDDCMLVEEDKEYCLDDCDLAEAEVQEKELCGDGICAETEKQSSTCPEDCPITCVADSDCEQKEICKETVCKPVDCKENADCPSGYVCEEYACVKEEAVNATEVEELQEDISALVADIDALIERIEGLQATLDAADASDEDKEAIQEDIDALDTVMTKLKSYNETAEGYSQDLEEATTADDVAAVKDAWTTAKTEIEDYLEEQQTVVDAIEEAIADLKPAEKPDLIIEDLDLEDVDGNDGAFTITFQNDDDGNITSSQTFRIKLTSFDDDNETVVDDSKTTVSTGLDPDEEDEVEIEVEMAFGIEQYFTDNPSVDALKLLFLAEIDIDDSVNESNETNNEKYFNVTFEREDWVTNTAPAAVIAANATSVFVDEVITFLGTASSDPDGSIASYNWTFGDSATVSTGSTQTYSYDFAGTYTVTLVVTDNEGATGTDTETITVS